MNEKKMNDVECNGSTPHPRGSTEIGVRDNPTPSHGVRWIKGCLRQFFRRPARSDLLALVLIWAVAFGLSAVAILLMVLVAGQAHAAVLTAGDRLQVVIESGEGFSGKYQVDVQGALLLPYAEPVQVAGLNPQSAAMALSAHLEQRGIFRPGAARTTVQVLWWAPLDIRVSGEVFNPGHHRVNMPASLDRAVERAEEIPGAYTPQRNLSDALKSAGGITPWSDLARIGLKRQGKVVFADLRHLISGEQGDDPFLQNGDEVMVGRLPFPQPAQVRPSGITPPGIKIYAGNLIQGQNNASAANGLGTLALTYGSRLSQGVIAANCVGGMFGGDRRAALLRTDRVSGKTQTWDVLVRELMTQADDRINPMLQEGDALACFDSSVSGWREAFRILGDVLLPISILKGF